MRDRAGDTLRKARRLNFRNKNQRVREFIGGETDTIDIFRFKARSSAIDITARKLNDDETVTLYQSKKPIGRTLRNIGKSEFTSIRSRKRRRFLSKVDLSVVDQAKKSTYSADVERGQYFLVVSSKADKNSRYTLRFAANPITTPTPNTPTPTSPTPQTPAVPDAIGNTIGTAAASPLGSAPSEAVGGTDTSDIYRFTLGDRQKVSLTLDGLSQNADLSLLDVGGKELKTSANTGTTAESIVRNLEQGTYYIKVSSISPIETTYTLTTSSTDPTQTSLFSAGGGAVPKDQGKLDLSQVPVTTDVIDRIVAGATINGQTVDALGQTVENRLKQYLQDNFSANAASETGGANGVTLNTQLDGSTNAGYVGYSNYTPDYDNVSVSVNPLEALAWFTTGAEPSSLEYNAALLPITGATPALDTATGYTVSFDASIDVENSGANRAGFSIVVVSNDGSSAIELGFTSSGIFAQSSTFTEAETFTPSSFTMDSFVSYDLYVADSGYQLFANGSEILSGSLRSYDFDPTASDPVLPVNPYTTKNFLFFGDNTDQASATFTLGNVSLFT